MHPAQIKAAIAMRDYTQSKIAAETKVEPNSVSAVIHGRSRSARIERRIALVTGLPLHVLWPQWYGDSPRRSLPSPAAVLAAVQAVA